MTPRPIEDEILDHYQSLMRHVGDAHAREFLEVDLTMSQAKLLYIVSLNPGVNMSVLAAELEVGLSAVSGLVDRLVALGYVDRHQDPDDRRQQLITLTAEGSFALDRLRELRAELMRRLLAGLATSELAALRDGLAALDREASHLCTAGPAAADPATTDPATTDPAIKAHPERTLA